MYKCTRASVQSIAIQKKELRIEKILSDFLYRSYLRGKMRETADNIPFIPVLPNRKLISYVVKGNFP